MTAENASDEIKSGKSAGAFRTISEVADELAVAQHVLRFWESKFPQVKPLKRGGGRRYYRPEDIAVLKDIQSLLYAQGYTIKGAQKLLRQKRAGDGHDDKTVQTKADEIEDQPVEQEGDERSIAPKLELIRQDLKEIRAQLDGLLQ